MNNKEIYHRYRLETYNPEIRKHICPACEKRTFVRYVDVETGEYLSNEVGRCDREEKCGYHKTPRDYFQEHDTGPNRSYFFPRPGSEEIRRNKTFSIIKPELAESTMTAYDRNNLFLYINSLWGPDAAQRILSSYAIGTCRFWPGATVFWQRDIDGRFRTGKIMLYDKNTGHRVKNPEAKIMWVHRLKMFSDFHLKQCLFGEHLLKGNTAPVAIVESEKTAAIASLFFPDVNFIATGGLNNLQSEKLGCLAWHRVILFPDLGAEEKWHEKLRTVPPLRNAKVSTWLMNNSTAEEKAQGLDIGDWLVRLPSIRTLRLQDFL